MKSNLMISTRGGKMIKTQHKKRINKEENKE